MLMLWFLFPCKSHGFCSHKGRVSFRNFHSSWRFWKKRNFHGEFGDKGQLTWNILRLILFDPTKRGEFGNPKLKEPNFPTDLFSVKLLLSNTSKLKSSKMKTMLQIFADNWSSLEGSMSNGPNHQDLQNNDFLVNMDHCKLGFQHRFSVNVPC